jgi:hypothetical protein
LNEHYLFQEVLARSHPRLYRDWGTYQISIIGKTNRLPGAKGQVFIRVIFSSPGKGHGPNVYFQIEDDQILIEKIGSWIS